MTPTAEVTQHRTDARRALVKRALLAAGLLPARPAYIRTAGGGLALLPLVIQHPAALVKGTF